MLGGTASLGPLPLAFAPAPLVAPELEVTSRVLKRYSVLVEGTAALDVLSLVGRSAGGALASPKGRSAGAFPGEGAAATLIERLLRVSVSAAL